MSTPPGQFKNTLTGNIPIKTGAIFGAMAYIAGFVVMLVVTQIDSELNNEIREASTELDEFGVGTMNVVSWVFSNAHFADLTVSSSGGDTSGIESENMIAEATTSFPEPIYYAIPIVILTITGYLLVKRVRVKPRAGSDAMKYGATLAFGYLPVSVAFWLIFRVRESETVFGETFSITIAPNLVFLVVTAILYPIILGAIGGYLAQTNEENTAGST